MTGRNIPPWGKRRRLQGGGSRCALEALETRQMLTSGYLVLNLVSDQPATALVQDANLVNPWGLALNSQGGDLWIANGGSSAASLYNGGVAGFAGQPATPFAPDTPAISLPGGTPTGAVYNGSTSFFVSSGSASGPASFLFAGLAGQIDGYNRSVPTTPSAQAETAATTPGAVYTGLAAAYNSALGQNLLYAADFQDNRIDVFNSSFNPTSTAGGFAAAAPAGYAPYNITNIAGQLYVSYALQGAGNDAAPGGGFVDVFDVNGNFVKQLVPLGSPLNAPWGMALAPASFGDYGGDLLVANHGNGTIVAFNPQTGAYLGTLALPSGGAITIDGLRGLSFGNGISTGGSSELFFSAGPNNGAHGLLGAIQSAQGVSLTAQGNAVTATANQSFSGTLAVFSDARNLTPGSFSATINWGDGTSATPGGILALAGGGYAVTGSHVYSLSGTKSISIQLGDSLGNTASAIAVAQVAIGGVAVTGLTFTPTEAIAFNGAVATFTDGDGNTSPAAYQATIAWGDNNSSSGTVSFASGKFTVSGMHTYSQEGTKTATVTVTDVDGTTAAANSIAKIADAPIYGTTAAINATLDATFAGAVGSFTDANPLASLNEFSATIDWGDGVKTAGTIAAGAGQSFNISGSHAYSTSGDKQVLVTVNDVGGSQAIITETASVVDIDVLGTTLVALAPTQGSAFLGTVANVTDSNPATTANQLAATIDWGDGTTTSGTLSGVNGSFAVAGQHTYIGEGIYTLSATISHVGGTATANDSEAIIVADIGSLSATGIVVAATEGAAFNGNVATVSDTFAAPASVFNATIDWGDGTQSPGTVSGPNGQFTVSGQHTYTAEGTYKPVVTIADRAPGTLSATTTLTAHVADAPLTAKSATLHVTENQTFTDTVATFSDANPFGKAADFTATIDWGDGTTSTPGTVTGSGGFTVSGSHAYTLGGTYTATVTIDDDGGSSAVALSKALVADYPLIATATTIVGREGQPFSGIVATFTDTDPAGGRLKDFTATIDWGDGGTTSGAITGGGGQYTVSGAYTFADVSNQVVVVINDAGGAAATATDAASIEDANTFTPTGLSLAGTEGQTVSGTLATIADTYIGNPASDFSATVIWGDGDTTAATVVGDHGQFTVNGSHVYAEAGSYTATVAFRHNAPGTAKTTTNATLAIADAPLSAGSVTLAAVEGATFAGQVATFHDANTLSKAADFTATITWGDGSTSTPGTITLLAAGGFAVTGTHVYTDEAQNLPVTVAIHEIGGSQVTANSKANVADAPLTASAVTITTTEGQTFSGTVATFNDANPFGTASDFTATVNWGDGSTTTAGTVSAVQNGFAIAGTHVYAEAANKLPITVVINDRGGSKATAASTAIVNDAPLTATAITFTATEGIAFSGTVATLIDGNSLAKASDFSATIIWGDGSTVEAGTVQAALGGGFVVNGTHTYAKTATRQVAVNIYDVGGSTASAVSSAKVVDAPIVPGAPLTVTATAGASFSGTLGTFTDLNPNAALASFNATIAWGDGFTSPATILAAPGQFILTGSHIYNSPAISAAITISVSHSDGATGTVLASAHVASPNFSAGGATITSVEGVTYSGVVGTANDSDPNPAHYSATINWGDGSISAGTLATATKGGFVVNGSHVFTSAGSFNMSVVVVNPWLDRLTVGSRANVADAPLTPLGVSFTATEGALYQGTVARFSDAGGGKASNFTATINWGDGGASAGTISATGGGNYAVIGSHTYANATASLAVSVSVNDVGGAKTTIASTAVVADAPLTLDPATITVPPGGVTNGLVLATFVDQGGAQPPSNYTATIQWGDGGTAAGLISTVGGKLQISGNHQYLLPGPFAIQVLVRDQAGGTGSATIQATVMPTANQLFVEAAYSDVLARPVDNNALIYWSGQLNAGQSRGILANAIDHSAEYFANIIVTPAYQHYLNRAPDAAGLAFWVDQLQNHGVTDERMEAGFISSPEFYARAGGTDKAWVDALYQSLLGRPADQAGETYWVQQLAAGVSRGQIAYDFATSTERESQRITYDYTHYLDRSPDQAGLNYWLKQFADGLTNENLITGFVSSDEYYARHSMMTA